MSHSKAFSLLICLITLVSCSKGLTETYSSDEMRWLRALTDVDLKGRKTGTEGCLHAASYICTELVEMGYSPKVEEFSYRDSITMRNIIVEIPGQSDSILIVGAHYDGAVKSSKYQAANDNASGVVALLSVAKSIRPNNDTVLLCFWDGEENTDGTAFNGSSYFVEHFNKRDYIKWYCNIDCCGRDENSIYLYYSPNMIQKFDDFVIPQDIALNITRKISEDENSSDYVPFKNKGIPFWGWNDIDVLKYIHTPNDATKFISIPKIQSVSYIIRTFINEE